MMRSTTIHPLEPGSIMLVSMPNAKSKRGYLSYSALEIAGMALILWDGLPIYRHLFVMERIGTKEDKAIMLVAVIAVQAGYWSTFRHGPPFEIPKRVFFAHVLLFMSRL